MCDPVSVMMAASAGISSLGAIAQGNAQKQAAELQAAQYRAQAELQNRQATMEQTAGQYQQRRQVEKLESLSATQRAMMGSSGFAMTGSPSDVVIDSQREGMLDVAAIKFGTDLKSSNLQYSAGVSNMNAQGAMRAADLIGTSTAIGAIAPFISLGANPQFQTQLGKLF